MQKGGQYFIVTYESQQNEFSVFRLDELNQKKQLPKLYFSSDSDFVEMPYLQMLTDAELGDSKYYFDGSVVVDFFNHQVSLAR